MIDPEAFKDEPMSEGERKEYCAAVSAVWPRLEKDIQRFQYNQLLFICNQALDWDQVLVARGTYNALALLEDHWKKAHLEHSQNLVKEPTFDKHNPIGEV